MQIEFEKPNVVNFDRIKIGDLFCDDGNVFLKIDELENCNGDFYNAICLADGEFAFYASLDKINKADGKLVVTLV